MYVFNYIPLELHEFLIFVLSCKVVSSAIHAMRSIFLTDRNTTVVKATIQLENLNATPCMSLFIDFGRKL